MNFITLTPKFRLMRKSTSSYNDFFGTGWFSLLFIFFSISFTKAILSIFSAFVKGMASMNSILSGK